MDNAAYHSWTKASGAGIVTTFKTRTVRRGTARTWQQNLRELIGISKNKTNTWADRYYTPSRSAPSSTSPMSPVPADDSSSNRESVLRSNAMFSMPLVGVLKQEKELCWFLLISVISCSLNYLQGLYPMRSISSSGVDSMMSCTSAFSSFSGNPERHTAQEPWQRWQRIHAGFLQLQARVESHWAWPWSYPLIWIWSPGQPAPLRSYCSCPPSPCPMPLWTSAWPTLSRWSLTTHPATKHSKFKRKICEGCWLHSCNRRLSWNFGFKSK